MLEFVHLTGPEAGKDEQTRRKVRSQAMRDFRRRQRAENDRRRNVSPQPASSRTREPKPSDSSVLGPRSRAQVDSKHAQSTAATRRAPSKASTANISLSIIDWNDDQIMQRNNRPMASMQQQSWSQISDSFDSEVHVNEMFGYCKSYLDWLCPEIDSEKAADVLTSRQGLERSPTSLAALCLASVGHLDAVRGDQSSLDYALYKARVFQNLNERMMQSDGVVSNETVAYLACLLSYEMSNCSPEAILHLQGLQSIIKLRGGMATLSAPFSMMLECLDLCHAIIFEEKPILALMDNAKTWASNIEQHLENCNSLVRLLRQEADNFYYETPETNPYRQRLLYTPQLIQDVIDVMQFLGPIPDFWRTVDIPDEVVAPYRQRLEAARSLTFEADPLCPDAHLLARTIYMRILLNYRLDVLRMHPDTPEIQELIDAIWDTMQKISEVAWQPWPYFRLWIVLVAIHLAKRPQTKSFFEAHLVRCVYRMGVDEWPRAKAFIIRFLSARSMFMTFLMRPQAPATYREMAQLNDALPAEAMPWRTTAENLGGYLATTQPDYSASMLHPLPVNLHHMDALPMEAPILSVDGMFDTWSLA